MSDTITDTPAVAASAPAPAPAPVATAQPAATARMPWLLIGVTFISMIVFGFAENIKGPVIPSIRETFGVSYGAIGVMLFVASLGYLSTTFIGGFAGDRFGQKAVLAAGYGLIILASLGMTQAQSFLAVCVLMYTLNAGFGCLEVGVNALGAQVFVRNAALMMNLVHLFYGAGSMVGPEYAAWMLEQGRPWSDVYAFASLLVLALFVVMMLVRFPRAPQKQGEQRIGLRQIARDKRVWLFVGVLGFCEVIELGTGNWLVSYLRGAYDMGTDQSATYLSLFFVTFTLGRLIGGYMMERIGYVQGILWFAVVTLGLYIAGQVLGKHGALLFSLTGFFISIMFPTVMAMIMKEFRIGTGSIMGFIITASGSVNMLFNWVIGQTSDILGVRAGFASFMLYTVIAIGLLLLLNRYLTFNKPAYAGQGT